SLRGRLYVLTTQGDHSPLMFTSTFKRKAAKVAALAITGALAVPLLSSGTAQADPRQHTDQLVGVGSDTIEAVFNAFAGESNGIYYTPVHTTGTSNLLQFSSWNAVAPGDHTNLTCISPRALFNAFQRPNGSTHGREALSRSLDGAAFNETGGDSACANKATSGIVDFARSSSASVVAGTDKLSYIAVGADAIGYASISTPGTTEHLDFTDAELKQIFTDSGSGTTIRGTLVIPCDIQHGSGTQKDWPGKVGSPVTVNTIDTASDACDALTPGIDTQGRIEENHIDQLAAKRDAWLNAHPGGQAQFIIGHGVSAFIAQSNGKAPSHLATGGTLGGIDFGSGVTQAFTGTAPSTAPNAAFYSSHYGRHVYMVWPKSVVEGLGNAPIKAMVVGSGSRVCAESATLQAFGFLDLGSGCGAIELHSDYFPNS
ncbi:MAG TPA: hypothetical protein VHD87_17005, partial [Acidimicrobiales bacterium]|nr:hypothetical protein [Acidimicrobiales bacterium]